MKSILKLEPFDIHELKNMKIFKKQSRRNYRSYLLILEAFLNDTNDCCKICVCEDGLTAQSECSHFIKAMDRFNFNNVKVVRRGTEVFLVKKNKWEEIQ